MNYVPHKKTRIEELAAESIALLREMIAVPSPSFEEEAVCSHICKWMGDKGIAHQRVGNNIICRNNQGSRSQMMLCAHIDTVKPSEDYSFDPYNPDYKTATEVISRMTDKVLNEEDLTAGLGSNDDGASVVSMIAAYRYLSEQEDAKDLILVLTCEEERSGKGGMTTLWKELKDEVEMAIVGEPTGMRAATSERGLLVIDAEAEGVSGHAARNEGVNALYIAIEDIGKIRAHKFAKVSPYMGEVNVNVTQINAGTAHNVIPDRCTFVVDIRPTEQYSNEEILNELQSICSSRLIPRNLSNRSSACSEGSPLLKVAQELGLETFSSPTTSDWMRITCDAVKMGPGESQRSHKKDEYVLTEEIRNGIYTYIAFIENLK
jgi:acetylornithine deacetylase